MPKAYRHSAMTYLLYCARCCYLLPRCNQVIWRSLERICSARDGTAHVCRLDARPGNDFVSKSMTMLAMVTGFGRVVP
jgi:hypothetical protein